MSTHVDSNRGVQAARQLHLNLAAPLTERTLETIQCKISMEMITMIAMQARNVIPCSPTPALTASDRASGANVHKAGSRGDRIGTEERLPSPPTTPSSSLSSVPPLVSFIQSLVERSRVQAGTLICTLVYLRRLRSRLPKEARGKKYLNDASPKNKYWARYSNVFTVAEVNLMEKQLLFLLDFDLRIDNHDLNEAAAVLFGGSIAGDVPLTPTTPPASTAQLKVDESVSALPAGPPLDSSTACRAGYKPADGYPNYQPYKQPSSDKIYPPTLGLGGSEAQKQPKRHASSSYVQDPVTPSSVNASMGRHTSGLSSALAKTPASLLRNNPGEDRNTLNPSPKKRAVSRGYHSNVPQPSPVYHCSGMLSAATTVQMPSTATAGSDCFLQPLDQPSLKHASSRYQQQRYDPRAAQKRQSTCPMPRASISIPSLRPERSLAASPSGYTGSSTHGSSARAQKSRHILRHQSTLPDMAKVSSLHDPASESGALSQSLSSMMKAHLEASALPAPPPPARLASGSYRSECSPGTTLAYDYSPASFGRTRVGSRQPSESRSGLDTLPVSAMPMAADSNKLPPVIDSSSNHDADKTLTYSHGYLASRSATADPAASGGSAGNGGWQLKSKLLHPLSSWFRSSRHHSAADNSASPSAELASAPKYVLAGGGSAQQH
ncbi:PHO85 cyclin-1 [Coemansia sp. RSA 2336]|nr:PHO85 cyclin-1 [Coemansia sp. RSA 2336]